jgi:branched-chain amino acid transport system substrate-binding protein
MRPPDSSNKSWRRRDLIKLFGATAIAGPAIFQRTMARAATSKVIKIGHVSSPTGVFAPFAQAEPFILNQMRTALGKGISNGGVGYQVQIISKDSQSSTTRASEVACSKSLGSHQKHCT